LTTGAPILSITRMKAVIDHGLGECVWQNKPHPTIQ